LGLAASAKFIGSVSSLGWTIGSFRHGYISKNRKGRITPASFKNYLQTKRRLAGFGNWYDSVGAGHFHQLVEGGYVVDGEFSQYFAVNLNSGFGQALNQTIVGQTDGTAGGVNTLNPQGPHIAFAGAPIAVGVP